MRVKICGITNLEDALICSENGADALGFILYNRSKRFIEPDKAKSIIKQLPAFIIKMGVFVNEDADKVNEIAQFTGLNAVQLHGDESPDYVKKIRYPVVKSFRINKEFDFSVLKKYPDYIYLLDSYSTSEYGGTGKTIDWNLIPENLKGKIILAGGITEKNVQEIHWIIRPAAVDVSSSLEVYPGKKEKMKVERFLKIVKALKKQ